jgi:putative selenate reductase molybdopterin-binding subunit
MITYSSDTDFTPFDKGAYASSTTYISGTAAVKAAQIVAERIKARAVDMFKVAGLNVEPSDLKLSKEWLSHPMEKVIPLSEIASTACIRTIRNRSWVWRVMSRPYRRRLCRSIR